MRNRKPRRNVVDDRKDFRTAVPTNTAAANEALEQFIFNVDLRQNFRDFTMAVNNLKPVRVYLRPSDGETMELSNVVRET